MNRSIQTILVGLLTASMTGCGDAGTNELPRSANVDVPPQFVQGPTTWTKAEAQDAIDTECLAHFFAVRQDLVGSPELEGEPHLFRAGSSDRRFYWLRASAEGPKWSCVAFEHGRFSVGDGTGNPFIQ